MCVKHSAQSWQEASATCLLLLLSFQEKDPFIPGNEDSRAPAECERRVCPSHSNSPSGPGGMVNPSPSHPSPVPGPVPNPALRGSPKMAAGCCPGLPSPPPSRFIAPHVGNGSSERQAARAISTSRSLLRSFLLLAPYFPCPAFSGWPGLLVQTVTEVTATTPAGPSPAHLPLQRTVLGHRKQTPAPEQTDLKLQH